MASNVASIIRSALDNVDLIIGYNDNECNNVAGESTVVFEDNSEDDTVLLGITANTESSTAECTLPAAVDKTVDAFSEVDER